MKVIVRWISFVALAGLLGCPTDEGQVANEQGEKPLAQRAGAPLFDGMGDFHMPITTLAPDAQRYFDQGMVLAFGFKHAESIRSFRAAQTLDPLCAMCYWGEALATGPNINVAIKQGNNNHLLIFNACACSYSHIPTNKSKAK